jgi:hypothetical protein
MPVGLLFFRLAKQWCVLESKSHKASLLSTQRASDFTSSSVVDMKVPTQGRGKKDGERGRLSRWCHLLQHPWS